ncbi:MAG: hypothetical protein JSR33_04945 [Proteobacteria bacterium]|nr:hypothetical protein [Pseudomonadota bacterium]
MLVLIGSAPMWIVLSIATGMTMEFNKLGKSVGESLTDYAREQWHEFPRI